MFVPVSFLLRHPVYSNVIRHVLLILCVTVLQIKSLDFHHGGSATHQAPVTDSNASLLDKYIKEPIYQPVGYGHASQEYVGVPQDITEQRKHR